jgi:nucleotide-binding universal stress UspA family protein
MFKHILLPTDGSSLSENSIRNGIQIAKALHARVTGVCAVLRVRQLYFDSEFPGVKTEHAAAAFKARAETYLSQVARAAKEAGVPCETVQETCDQVYEAIIRVAETKSCDLIVMASHGRAGIGALLLGSETQKVLTHSKIPVLVYR